MLFHRIFELRRKDAPNARHYVYLVHLLGGGQLNSSFCSMSVHWYSWPQLNKKYLDIWFFPLFANLMWTVGIVMWRPMFLFHVKVVHLQHNEGSTAELHLTRCNFMGRPTVQSRVGNTHPAVCGAGNTACQSWTQHSGPDLISYICWIKSQPYSWYALPSSAKQTN